MKTLLIFISFLGFLSCNAQGQQFDIVRYTAPAGWQKSEKPETLSFSKETDKGFCIITVYKSIDGSQDAQKNFDVSWESLVQNIMGAGKPTMQPATTDNGWQTLIGSSQFEKGGIKGAVILITSSKDSKLVNIIVITNTDAFQKEMEIFLDKIVLKGEGVKSNDLGPDNIQRNTSANNSKAKPELWAGRRLINNDPFDGASVLKTISDYFVIYPNGDYLQNVPYEGLKTLDKSYQSQSWGKFTMQGNKGRFKNNYDEIKVTRKSATHLEKDGYNYGIYKCLPVDGLRIEGAYTHVAPNWGKDPQLNYLDGAGCQFVIYFKEDGTFDDRGIFSTNKENCTGGKGTYSIENFTITFNYEDGRVVNRLFSAPPTRDPKRYSEVYYIGQTAYYKKNKK